MACVGQAAARGWLGGFGLLVGGQDRPIADMGADPPLPTLQDGTSAILVGGEK